MLLGDAIMKSRWAGVALIAAGLVVGTASGQPPFAPTPVGAARIPEPVPVCEQPPPMMPGPLTPYTLPAVKTEETTLPAGHSSAFQCENFVPEQACYLHLGSIGLIRQNYGHLLVAAADPINLKNGLFSDLAVPFIDLHEVPQHMQWGVTGTVGYTWDDATKAIEATAWYLWPAANIGKTVSQPGRIDSFFFNPPVGFEGDNGLWLHADTMTFRQRSTVFNGEVNFRWSSRAVNDFDLIIGVRYIAFHDQLDIFTDDDGQTFPLANGQPDPTRQALYRVSTSNQLVGPQMGFEWDTPVPFTCGLFSAGFISKAAWAINFASTDHVLVRGDGFPGFATTRHSVQPTAGIFDLGFFVETHPFERVRIRGGYNLLWLTGMKMAQDQVDFNLAHPFGQDNRHGNVFFHGPSIELQLLF
jgi:hypothetical protein